MSTAILGRAQSVQPPPRPSGHRIEQRPARRGRKKGGTAFGPAQDRPSLHRRGLLRQPRPRGLGGRSPVRGGRKGALRRGARDHQQPHGAHRRHPGAGGPPGALPGYPHQRQPLPHRRRHQGLAQLLAAPGLEAGQKRTGPQRGPVAAPPPPAGAAPGGVCLGAGPRRPPGKRALRPDGGSGIRQVPVSSGLASPNVPGDSG